MVDFDDGNTVDEIIPKLMSHMGMTQEMLNPPIKHELILKLSLEEIIKIAEWCRANNIGMSYYEIKGK